MSSIPLQITATFRRRRDKTSAKELDSTDRHKPQKNTNLKDTKRIHLRDFAVGKVNTKYNYM